MGRVSTSVTVLFLGLLVSGVVPAGEHEHQSGSPMEGMMGMMKNRMQGKDNGMMEDMCMMSYPHAVLAHAEELKLSDEQMGKIVRIELRHDSEHKKIMEHMRKSMHQVHKSLMDPAADPAGIREASKEHSRVHQDIVEDRIKERDEVHAILTPEQREQLKALVEAKNEKTEEHKKHHP